MTEELHPTVAAVLRHSEQLQSIMDDQLHKMNTQTFTATDESETVQVTLDGHQQLTHIHIEDGLLRLGAATVEQRLNEALQKATATAMSSIEADRERIDAMVNQMSDELGHLLE
ncbi:YbaB/EbfC family nucleoid-associated protein [Mycolicibacterium thermoresistibile]